MSHSFDETERLHALERLNILDSPDEEMFDRITRVGARLFRAPICLVSFVDAERQWFKSRVGLDLCETGREASLCAHALGKPEPLVVEDTHLDPRFNDNPLVTGPPYIRFYVGAQLRTGNGSDVGALCVIDREPRPAPEPQDLAALVDLADTVVLLLEQRRLATNLTTENKRRRSAERQALEARKLADEANTSMRSFFSRVSHDLRTPLGGVLGYAEFLREANLTSEEREDLDQIVKSGKKMLEMIDELLAVSREHSSEAQENTEA